MMADLLVFDSALWLDASVVFAGGKIKRLAIANASLLSPRQLV